MSFSDEVVTNHTQTTKVTFSPESVGFSRSPVGSNDFKFARTSRDPSRVQLQFDDVTVGIRVLFRTFQRTFGRSTFRHTVVTRFGDK